ncbi:MAG: hypothetical protein M3Q24_00250 [bacterium]|nr:hypothetical protein [bacterium]
MISLESLREIEPALQKLSDHELVVVRNLLYAQGQLVFEMWLEKQGGSKNPLRVGGLPEIDM